MREHSVSGASLLSRGPAFRRRRGASTAAIVLTMAFSAPAFAQTPPASPALTVPAQVPEPSGAVRRLTVDDAVKLALEQNLGIRIQRIDPQIQDVGIAQARSFWAPTVLSAVSRNSQTVQPTNALSGGATSILNGNTDTQVGMNQTLPWGGSYSATWDNARVTSTNLFNNYSPQLNSTLNVQYTQPLLRNFRIDQIRQQVKISQKYRDLSDIQLQSVIVGTERNVKNAYWDLAYAINNVAAQRESLALAQQSLKDNQKRVEIGTMAPIDIVQAEAEVASNQQNVIVAEAAIKTAEDQLRALILDPSTPDFWTVSLEPTDTAPFQETAIDVDSAVRNALDKRADLLAARNSLGQSDINMRYFRNQILPDVNATMRYVTTASGGVQLSPVDLAAVAAGQPVGNRSIVSDRGFGTVLGDVFGASYPNWTFGVQIAYPLGTSTAHANLARAKLQYEQSHVQLKNLELQVATQVRLAGRQVRTNEQRVKSARASRGLQEKKLEAEQKKFAAGMSTSFFVFQAQRDLAQARTLEIQAISDYNKSLVDFEAVQQVPLTGGLGGIVTAGSGAVQTGNNAIVRQQ